MVTYQLARFDAAATGASYRLAGFDAAAGGATVYRLAGFDASAGSAVDVSLGPVSPSTFGPFDIAVLTASSVVPPDSWLFQEISGFGGTVITPTVTLTGSGGIRSYRCPGRLFTQERYFRVTVTKGTATATAEVKHTVAPHSGFFGPGGIGWQTHSVPGQ